MKNDLFSPYIFFPFVFVLYFSFGHFFDFNRSELFHLNTSIFPVVFLFLLFYYLGVIFCRVLNVELFKVSLFEKFKIIYFVYILGTIGFISLFILLSTGQIGLSDESVRRSLDPKLYFLSGFLWFSSIVSIFYHLKTSTVLTVKKKLFYFCFYFVVFSFFVLLGYRTPLVIMFFTGLVFFHYSLSRIKLKTILIVSILLVLVLSIFSYLRVANEDKTKEFNQQTVVPVLSTEDTEVVKNINDTPEILLTFTKEFVNARIVLSRIIEYTNLEGTLNGDLHYGIFSTVLPGEQTSPRMMITEMVNSLSFNNVLVTREGRTTTPTIVGQLYADGGYLLVIVGSMIFGFILSLLYSELKNDYPFSSIAYSFTLTIFVLSIHTGLLDLLFILMVFIVIGLSMLNKKRT